MPQGISYKKIALKTAKELGYDGSVIKSIKEAETDQEIEHIMVTARKEKDDD